MADTYILFQLAATTYAVESDHVQQMEMVETITPVPNAPPAVEGVVFTRGQVIPAVNLRTRLGLPRAPYDLRTRLMVVRSGERVVGLIVDSAREFVTIAAASVQPPPQSIAGPGGGALRGIATLDGRLVLILDVSAVLAGTQIPA